MYRNADYQVFMIVSTVATILLIAAFILMLAYHFHEPRVNYRDFAFLILMVSLLLRVQLTMQKVEIFEKRLMSLTHSTMPGGKLALSTSNLTLIFYLSIFWLTVLCLILAFLPANVRFSQLMS